MAWPRDGSHVIAASKDPSLAHDLDEILEDAGADILRFRGARLFMTGGTGFVGKWFLSSIVHANQRADARIIVDVLTRDPERFRREVPHLAAGSDVHLLRGDIVTRPPLPRRYDGVIHAATPASAALNQADPGAMLHTIVEGGRCALEIASRCAGIPFLFTSSGAVYGRQPTGLVLMDENYSGAPNQLDVHSAYGEGKRTTELQCAIAASAGTSSVIARMFAFVGPYLPIDQHFAIGNFVRNAIQGETIQIAGDGSPFRSYLYASDMISWLWAVLARGRVNRAYNVGSEDAVDIEGLARLVANSVRPALGVTIAKERDASRPPERYVPSTQRARHELGVRQRVVLRDAIARTVAWHRPNA